MAVPKGTPPDDLLDPGFWSNVAPSLLVGDWIRAVADDGTFEGLLSVRAVSGPGHGRLNNRALVAMLNSWKFDAIDPTATAVVTHRVEHRGVHSKWSIVAMADGAIVKDGFPDEEAARSALTAFLKAQS